MYRTVLLPTDGSPDSMRAVSHAVDLARSTGATLHALHVTDTGAVPLDAHAQRTLALIENEGRAALDEIEAEATGIGVEVVCANVEGSPAEAILDYAGEHDVDVVVMGTHGRSGLRRYLLGSVTEQVVRNAPMPVLTVPPGDRDGDGDGDEGEDEDEEGETRE